MYKRLNNLLLLNIGAIVLALSLFSCGSTKHLRYFQDIPDSTRINNIKLSKFVVPVIQSGDMLSITILTVDETATANVNLANSPAVSTQTGATQTDLSGYLVDKDGNIEILELGKIKVAGLTIDEAREVIKSKAILYFKDPIINIKNKNIKVTILGEIGRPGTFNVTTEKVTILDAIALAGDLNITAKRDNILLLRQNDNNMLSSVRISLKNSDILRSPYFYLQNNDVIYVEPNKSRGISTDLQFTRTLQIYTLTAGILTTLLLIFRR